ncbi:MAG TPA: RNA polymerase subunit sigma [Verrucomicrobiales bacterium]|nr:RNA polymerase subunit sigma [Verrucomicrobiales bacterium]
MDSGEPKPPEGRYQEPAEAGRILPRVYQQLRRLAAQKLSNESANHTLQPTALVHEAYLRLSLGDRQGWDNDGHFFIAAANAMRTILIDHARRKLSQKRGGGLRRTSLDRLALSSTDSPDSVIAVDEAVDKLMEVDPQSAELIKLRFFGGLRLDDAARALGISSRTAKRRWAFARAWLYNELRGTLLNEKMPHPSAKISGMDG